MKIIGIDPGNEETAYAVMAECKDNHRRTAQIIIGKHRGGPIGVVNCEYVGEHTTFREAQYG